MKNLLSKDQVMLISEKVVDWNKSALGILVNTTILSPLSWMYGSLKKGLRKKQLKSLYMSWGAEYVKALHALDTGKEIEEDIDEGEKAEGQEPEENQSDFSNDIQLLSNADVSFRSLFVLISELTSWAAINNEAGLKKFKSQASSLLEYQSQGLDEVLEKYLKEMGDNEGVAKIVNPNGPYDALNSFVDTLLESDVNTLGSSLGVKDINEFKKKVEETKLHIGALVPLLKKVEDFLKKKNESPEKEENEQENKNDQEQENTSESLIPINEKAEAKLPETIEGLISREFLMSFELNPDIKKLTLEKINFPRLDIIKYEAEFIISKSQSDGKDGESTAELRREWDLGIKKVNEYFQKVIDYEAVMKKINPASVPEDKKKTVEESNKNIQDMVKLGITEPFIEGKKFESGKLYAFQVNITGQNNKNLSNINMLLTPVQNSEQAVAGSKFTWFKLLGFYSYDEQSKKAVRRNILDGLTQNPTIKKNFGAEGSHLFVCFSNVKVQANRTYMYMYTSQEGSVFFEDTNYRNANDLNNEIARLAGNSQGDLAKTLKEVRNVANTFLVKVNQRFVIEDDKVANFSGIDTNALKTDGNIKKAKDNHEKLIKIMTTK
jgi:hypothetical protein